MFSREGGLGDDEVDGRSLIVHDGKAVRKGDFDL